MIKMLISDIEIEDNNKVSIDSFEIDSSGENSYTIDTINYLQTKYNNDLLYMIIGEDQLAQLPNWKDFKEIIKKVSIICFKRKDSEIVDNQMLSISKIIDFDYKFSSSSIRKKISKNHDFKIDTTPEIYNYIINNSLYLDNSEEVIY